MKVTGEMRLTQARTEALAVLGSQLQQAEVYRIWAKDGTPEAAQLDQLIPQIRAEIVTVKDPDWRPAAHA